VKTIFKVGDSAEIVNPPPEIREKIKQACTLPNPAFVEAEKHGRYTGHLEPELRFYDSYGDAIIFLRGYARQAAGMLKQAGVKFDIEDHRRALEPVNFQFKGKLRPYQKQAVDAALSRESGILEMPTGGGKTTVALYLIASRKQPALVLVHNLELAHQWIERAWQFLGVEAGLFGNGQQEINSHPPDSTKAPAQAAPAFRPPDSG
jgi:hypothetical protein